MKAILKATGEIVTVECRWVTTIGGNDVLRFIDQKTGYSYTEHQLAILFQEDNNREPDYWTRLEHTYAGMAMQGLILTASKHMGTDQEVAQWAKEYAHALVEKMKEERK
jgi:hypothetical protein